ncbi:hypothetical protein DFQ27_001249 [Actinomortierella ambigua]|uniref:Phosphatidic acid phosphatase type 2/haloperoxidase domain-containing protein n=1 Tax=Actinomortierella ambigua TaxID=1343610 RepID=A0A9P6QNM3_9FUNG|nr:hypothetical protein DFQ27_001249 [Actinomortierella ambigua]
MSNRHLHRRLPPQGSVLGALSISLYESMSFSRSPSFERTRYIVSTCTFITIIYLRTLHCLFFGTGALSCAVLAKCLKHIIRQPRPYVARIDEEDDMAVITANDPVTAPPPSTLSKSGTASSPKAGEAAMLHMSTSSTTNFDEDTSTAQLSMTAASVQVDSSDTAEPETTVPSSPLTASAPSPDTATTTTTNNNNNNNANNNNNNTTRPKIKRLRLQNRHRRKILFRLDYGMPSSHAQLVAFFVCYISLQLILTMEGEQGAFFGQWFLILLLQLYAWSVVWSRVRLGRHTVKQVLVGAAVGAIYGIVWFTLWCWKVEAMIQQWQWMDRYGVIQVRKMWRQLEMESSRLDTRGRMLFEPMHPRQHQHHLHRDRLLPLGF